MKRYAMGLVVTAVSLMGVSHASGLQIDDYGAGSTFPVVLMSGDTLLDPDILGGELAFASQSVPPTAGFPLATLTEFGGVGTINAGATGSSRSFLHYDGTNGGGGTGEFTAAVDLTDGGASDGFLIDITNVVGTPQIDLQVNRFGSPSDVIVTSLVEVTAPGTLAIAFSASNLFGSATLSQVVGEAGRLYLSVRLDAGESISINNFSTGVVPEPASLALLGLGGSALLGRRRGA